VQMPHHNLTTWMEPRGNIKVVSIKINSTYATSLLLNFHLIRSLEGYTVGTTMGFWVKTVEALPPKNFTTESYESARRCV
jgi:hypothetical protein